MHFKTNNLLDFLNTRDFPLPNLVWYSTLPLLEKVWLKETLSDAIMISISLKHSLEQALGIDCIVFCYNLYDIQIMYVYERYHN